MNQLYNALFSIGLCFILSPACHTTTQAQELLTLEEAIQIGLENNFAIQIADNKQKIAAHDHTLGQAGFLPTIAASLSEDLDKQHGDIHSKLRLKPRANVVLNWTIFDGLGMCFAYQRLGKLRQLGELQAKKTMKTKWLLLSPPTMQ